MSPDPLIASIPIAAYAAGWIIGRRHTINERRNLRRQLRIAHNRTRQLELDVERAKALLLVSDNRHAGMTRRLNEMQQFCAVIGTDIGGEP